MKFTRYFSQTSLFALIFLITPGGALAWDPNDYLKEPLDPIYSSEWNDIVQHSSSWERGNLDEDSNIFLNTTGAVGIGISTDTELSTSRVGTRLDVSGFLRLRDYTNCTTLTTDQDGNVRCTTSPLLSSITCQSNEILRYNGNNWECAVNTGGGGGLTHVITDGTTVQGSGTSNSDPIRSEILQNLVGSVNCSNSDTDKLLWNGQYFYCGQDQNTGGGGSGGGTVTSLSVGAGLVADNHPITTTGTIAVDVAQVCDDPVNNKLLWNGNQFVCGTDQKSTGNNVALGNGLKFDNSQAITIDLAQGCTDGEKLFWDGTNFSCRTDLNTGGAGEGAIKVDTSIFAWETLTNGEKQLTLEGFNFASTLGMCFDTPGAYRKINWNGSEFVCQPDVTGNNVTDDGRTGNINIPLYELSNLPANTTTGITDLSEEDTYDRGTLAGAGTSKNPFRVNIQDNREGELLASGANWDTTAYLAGCEEGYSLQWNPERVDPNDPTITSPAFVCKPDFFTDNGETISSVPPAGNSEHLFPFDEVADTPPLWNDVILTGTIVGRGSDLDPLRLNILGESDGGTSDQTDPEAFIDGCEPGYSLRWIPVGSPENTSGTSEFRCMPSSFLTDDGEISEDSNDPFPLTDPDEIDPAKAVVQGTLSGYGTLDDPLSVNILGNDGVNPANYAYQTGCADGYVLKWTPIGGTNGPGYYCEEVGILTDEDGTDTITTIANTYIHGTLIGLGTEADPLRVNFDADLTDGEVISDTCPIGQEINWDATNNQFVCADDEVVTDDDTSTTNTGHEAERTILGNGTPTNPLRVPLENNGATNVPVASANTTIPRCNAPDVNPTIGNPQKLTWDGEKFVCEDEAGGVITDYVGQITAHATTGAILGDGSTANPLHISGISTPSSVTAACTSTEKLTWTGTAFECETEAGAYSVGPGGQTTVPGGLIIDNGGHTIQVSAPECDFVTGKLLWRAGQGFICANDQGSVGGSGFPTADTGVLSVQAGAGLAANGVPGGVILEEGYLEINAPECSNDEHKLTWNGQNFECAVDQTGVTQLIAGDNIALTSSNGDGTGVVEISATGGLSGVFTDGSINGDGTVGDPLGVNDEEFQRRISPLGGCEIGYTIRDIQQDGTIICEKDDKGAESVTAGAGLMGGTIDEVNPEGTISIAGPMNCWGPDKKLLWTGSMFICGTDRDTNGWGNQVVQHDITLTGDGTYNSPLSINVQVDETTPISGNGTEADPLRVDIISDNSVLGNGTVNNPLRVNFENVCWVQDGQRTMTTCQTKVGVGLVNPQEKFVTKGNILALSPNVDNAGVLLLSTAGAIELKSGSNEKSYIDFKGVNNLQEDFVGRILNDDAVGMSFITNKSEKMRILNNGRVGIGTTTPQGKLDVNGDAYAIRFLYASDRNLKKDIETLDSALERVIQLRGVSFDWKKDGREDIGLIAQEVEDIYPELVSTNEEGIKSLEYANLIAPVIEAIKEQQKIIETQQQEIDKLKAALN